jgi:glycosyltransferase involved in cell wall biosynthesis
VVDLTQTRVCFVAGTLGQGGAERQLFYIVKALKHSGAAVQVLTLEKDEFWQPHIEALGVPVTWVGREPGRLSRLRRIVLELRKQRPHIIQSQHLYTNLYATAAARMLGVRDVGAVRGDSAHEAQSCGAVMGRLSFRAPRVVAANSHATIQAAESLGLRRGPFLFLPNVVDTDEFRPSAAPPGARTVSLVFVGRLVPAKRVDRFLSILAQLRKCSPVPVRATIAGSGPEQPALMRQASVLGLMPDGVSFTKTGATPSAVYAAADVFVLTSQFEGTPNVVLEAMASGLPVVAMKAGDVGEIVRHGETGFVAEVGDERRMVELLLELVTNRSRRVDMGRAARAHIEATRSFHLLPDILQSFYGAAVS